MMHIEGPQSPALQLLDDIDRAIHSLMQLLREEPRLLCTALYLYEALHETREILKKDGELWR